MQTPVNVWTPVMLMQFVSKAQMDCTLVNVAQALMEMDLTVLVSRTDHERATSVLLNEVAFSWDSDQMGER